VLVYWHTCTITVFIYLNMCILGRVQTAWELASLLVNVQYRFLSEQWDSVCYMSEEIVICKHKHLLCMSIAVMGVLSSNINIVSHYVATSVNFLAAMHRCCFYILQLYRWCLVSLSTHWNLATVYIVTGNHNYFHFCLFCVTLLCSRIFLLSRLIMIHWLWSD